MMMMISTMNERRRFVMVSQKLRREEQVLYLSMIPAFLLSSELGMSKSKVDECKGWSAVPPFWILKYRLSVFSWLYELSMIGAYFFFLFSE